MRTEKQLRKEVERKQLAQSLYEDPTQLYTTTFNHIYFVSGFAISKAMTEDGRGYNPPKTHACLSCGYWCWQNAKEKPSDVFRYITRPLRILIHKLQSDHD